MCIYSERFLREFVISLEIYTVIFAHVLLHVYIEFTFVFSYIYLLPMFVKDCSSSGNYVISCYSIRIRIIYFPPFFLVKVAALIKLH